MHTYTIATDGFTTTVYAKSTKHALRQAGLPAHVNSPAAFRCWLEQSGGHGFIERDGERLIDIRA